MKKQRYRALVFCKGRDAHWLREGSSGWVDTIAEANDWTHKEQHEWQCPSGKRFIIEAELKSPRYTICPHCGGAMGKDGIAELDGTDYNCHKCGRAWWINSKSHVWHAQYSAGFEVYSRTEVRDMQMHKQLLEWRTEN